MFNLTHILVYGLLSVAFGLLPHWYGKTIGVLLILVCWRYGVVQGWWS
jgi:hypothetical protein